MHTALNIPTLPEKPTWKDKEVYIKTWLATNDTAVMRGVVAIYRRQTDAEKNAKATQEDNGVGFTGVDAEILTSFAQQILRWGRLSPAQMFLARKKIMKYWRQLWSVKEENDAKRLQQAFALNMQRAEQLTLEEANA